jgi:hypothetical protein
METLSGWSNQAGRLTNYSGERLDCLVSW